MEHNVDNVRMELEPVPSIHPRLFITTRGSNKGKQTS